MARALICPGLPRTGTTYLSYIFSRPENKDYFNLPHHKEMTSLYKGGFINDFDYPNVVDGRIYLDFSPQYSVKSDRFIEELKNVNLSHEYQFIFMLREPLEQMFSHYLHDIQEHISTQITTGNAIYYPLMAPSVFNKYVRSHSAMIQAIRKQFGNDSIIFLNSDQMFANLNGAFLQISDFLGIDEIKYTSTVISPGGWMPEIKYGFSEGIDVLFDDIVYFLEPGSLLLINGDFSKVLYDVHESTAIAHLHHAQGWTSHLTEEACDILRKTILKDEVELFSECLNQDLTKSALPSLSAKRPLLSKELKDRLKVRTTLIERFYIRHNM